MPIGKSREEQELNALLVKNLVQPEVLAPMDKIGWTHGTPPPPERGQPAPTEGAPGQAAATKPATETGQPGTSTAAAAATDKSKADTPKIEDLIAGYEALRDPETGLISRKYKTVEQAIQGGVHLTHMAKDAYSKLDAATAELAALREENMKLRQAPPAHSSAAPQPKPDPALSRVMDQAQANFDAVLSRITENGGVLDAETAPALSKAQRELAEAAADVRVKERSAEAKQAEDAERAAWDGVEDHMTKNHPDAARFSEEVALHLKNSPLDARAVNAMLAQGDRIGATEYAWLSFVRVHGDQFSEKEKADKESKEAELAAREKVRQELTEQARKDAGVVTGSTGGGGVHQNPAAIAARAETLAALTEAMRREGDAPGSEAGKAFRRALMPELFGSQ